MRLRDATATSVCPLVVIFVAACASSTAPPSTATRSTSSAAASVAAPVDDAARDAFFALIRSGDDDGVAAALAKNAALASAHDAKGRSAFMTALGRVVGGEGFRLPRENRSAQSILAAHPELDPLEAAAAGDAARVESEIAKDAGYVRRVHALGWTALHFAAFGGHPKIVELLLTRSADIEARAKNQFDNTPLQVALLTQQDEVVRTLIARGANVRATQAAGFTALHEAAQSGNLALVTMLLEGGADIDARSTRGGEDGKSPGQTVIEVAIKSKRDAVVAFLRAHGARE